MRKILSVLITAGIILTACKKEHHIKMDDSSLQKVTFKVGFSQTSGSFDTGLKLAAADTSLTNNIDRLYYMVFDADGNSLHTITQAGVEAGFGTFTDNLHAGNYTIAVAAIRLTNQFQGLTITPGTLNTQFVTPADGQQLFFKKVSFVVSGSPSTQSINLQRVDSELQLIIKDAIPAGISQIKITMVNAYTSYIIGSGGGFRPFAKTYSFDVAPALAGTTNLKLTSAPFIGNGTAVLEIQAIQKNPNGSGTIISDKTNINITTGPNKITVLTGNLFGGNGGSGGGFSLSLPNWNTPTTQGF